MNHTATLLPDGRIVVVGGEQRSLDADGIERSETLRTVEVYWPADPHWRQMTLLHQARADHHAVLLADGRLLIFGGGRVEDDRFVALDTSETYDPGLDTWTVVDGTPGTALEAGLLLPDGRVFTLGSIGEYPDAQLVPMLFDPASSEWSRGATAPEMRIHAALALLGDGSILVAGGASDLADGPPSPNPETWRYDPGSDEWTPAASLAGDGIFDGRAFTLPSGRVVVISSSGTHAYDPEADAWSPLASPVGERYVPNAVLLRDGRVLSAGGLGCSEKSELTEVYDPVADAWTPVGEVAINSRATLLALPSGRAVLIGGAWACSGPDQVFGPFADAFVFDPTAVH